MDNGHVRLAFAALSVYVIGGIATFGGIGLLLFMRDSNLFGWGSGHSLGYLFICIGLAMTVVGVLVMRILRNRGLT